jgi:hypothetical protein
MPFCPLSRQQLQDLETLLRRLPANVNREAVLNPFMQPVMAKASQSMSQTSSAGQLAANGAAGANAASGKASALPKSPALKPANSFSGLQAVVGGDDALRCVWGWKAADAALYFTWLAYAPLRCPQCGTVSAGFQPSVDDEYRCNECHASVGGAGMRDVVEEMGGENEDAGSDDEGDHDDGLAGGGTGDLSVLQTVKFVLVILRAVGADVPVSGYPPILKAATTISQLLLLPDCDPESHNVHRCAALYVACAVLVPAKLPFPTLQRVSNCGLQWKDCIAAADAIGTDLEDFFDDATEHTRNLIADLPHPRPPSKLWNPAREPRIKTDFDEMKLLLRPQRHSPDHTAAFAMLELCRRHEEWAVDALLQWVDKLMAADPKFAALRDQPVLLQFEESESTALSILLSYFALHFDIHPLGMCRKLVSSGLYGGKVGDDVALQNGLSCGLYPIPLTTRNSPVESPWVPIYRALHSNDRMILLGLLSALSRSPSAAQDLPSATKTLRAILAKHGAVSGYTANYCLRVADDSEAAFNGDYFCTSVTPDGASFVHFSKPLSIRYRAKTLVVYLNDPHTPPAQRRSTAQLNTIVIPPVTIDVESPSAKLIIDCVAHRQGLERWSEAVRRLDMRYDLRRRMRATTSLVAKASILVAADVSSGIGRSADINMACSHSVLCTKPTVEWSYAGCETLTDMPATALHPCTRDTNIAVAAAALQHVLEAMPPAAAQEISGMAAANGIMSPSQARKSPRNVGVLSPRPSQTTVRHSPQGRTRGAPGMPPLTLPPSVADAVEADASAAGASPSPVLAAVSVSDGPRSLSRLQFKLDDARILRQLVRQTSDRVNAARRRPRSSDDVTAEFLSSLEETRSTPLQPRPNMAFPSRS